MARLPKITLQGWTADGPAYTIRRPAAGFSNRKARRDGSGGGEQVGDHDAIDPDLVDPAAYMVLAAGDSEIYAFKAGHVYLVTLLVDGDATSVLVDAREGDRIETYRGDVQLLEQRAIEGEELEAALSDGPEEESNVSDGAESQAGITALTGAQTEDDDEPSEHDFDGTIPEFVELIEAIEVADLEGYRDQDSRKGVREAAEHDLARRADEDSPGDDEDAVGGDGASASDEEE